MAFWNVWPIASVTSLTAASSRLSPSRSTESESEALQASADVTMCQSIDPHGTLVLTWQEAPWRESSWTAMTWNSTAAYLGKAGTITTNKGAGLLWGSQDNPCNTDRWHWSEKKMHHFAPHTLQLNAQPVLGDVPRYATCKARPNILQNSTKTSFLRDWQGIN